MLKNALNKSDDSQIVYKLINFAWHHEADRIQIVTPQTNQQVSISYFGGSDKLSDWVLSKAEEQKVWSKLLQLAEIQGERAEGAFLTPGPQGALHCQVEKIATADNECLIIKVKEVNDDHRWSEAQFDSLNSEKLLACLSGKGWGIISGNDKAWTIKLAYTLLTSLSHEQSCLASLEDPVVKKLSGVNQCQWQKGRGRNYNQLFEAITAQDPDVIYVSELDRLDKHSLAVAASNKLIFGRLHDKNITQILRDLMTKQDSKPLLSSLKFILQVYLVKKNCPHCLQPYKLSKTESQKLAELAGLSQEELTAANFAESRGCERCQFSGQDGQIPLYDILFLNPALRQKLSQGKFNKQTIELITQEMDLNALEDAWLKSNLQLISPSEIIHQFA